MSQGYYLPSSFGRARGSGLRFGTGSVPEAFEPDAGSAAVGKTTDEAKSSSQTWMVAPMTTAGQTINVRVNDRARSVQPGVTLLGLLDELGCGARQGCAVAVNAAVVPRLAWAKRSLQEGDDVLIIQASQGG